MLILLQSLLAAGASTSAAAAYSSAPPPAPLPFTYWRAPIAPPHGPAVTKAVLVMRHCVRAASPAMLGGAEGFDSLWNYTSHPPIEYDAKAYECLARGKTLVQGLGWNLKKALPPPITVTYDAAADRDHDTAVALLQGLGDAGPGAAAAVPNYPLFDPVENDPKKTGKNGTGERSKVRRTTSSCG